MSTEFPYKPSWPILPLSPELINEAIIEYTKPLDQIASDMDAIVASNYLVRFGDPVRHDDHNTVATSVSRIYGALARINDELKKLPAQGITLSESVNPLSFLKAACIAGYTEFCDFVNYIYISNGFVLDDFRNAITSSMINGLVPIGTKDITTISTTYSEASELGISTIYHADPGYFPAFTAAAVKISDFAGSSPITLLHIHIDKGFRTASGTTIVDQFDLYIRASGSEMVLEFYEAGSLKSSESVSIDLTSKYVAIAVTAKFTTYTLGPGITPEGFDYFKLWILDIPFNVLKVLDISSYVQLIKTAESVSIYYTSMDLHLANIIDVNNYLCAKYDWIAIASTIMGPLTSYGP